MKARNQIHWQVLGRCLCLMSVLVWVLAGGCPSNNADVTTGDGSGDVDANGSGSGAGDDNGSGAGDGGSDDNGDGSGDDGEPNAPQETTYTLTVTVSGQGSVDPPTGEYDAGETLSLTPTPAAGWRFDHWEGDATGDDNPLSITLSEDMTITAVFVSFGDTAVQFYAVYDRILDTDELGDPFNIHLARMNKDGNKVFVVNGAGDGNDRKGWVISDLAGSSRTGFDLPDGEGQIRFLAVAGNGSRAYMTSGYEDEIYKWESGAITTIDVSGDPGPLDLAALATTETGDQVFLKDDWNLWRVNANGTGLQLLIEANTVPVADGTAYRVWDMDVDDSGELIAFLTYIQRPEGNIVELFLWDGGTITQLTDDRTGIKAYVRIAPDGSRIVYQDQAALEYVIIGSDGSDKESLVPSGNNFGGNIGLNESGSQIVYNDTGGRGGKLVDTASGTPFEIMPYTIPLSITEQVCMTGDGEQIMFIYRWSSSPLEQAVYIGYFDDTTAVADKPHIMDPAFSPTSLSRSAGGDVALAFTISDSDGLADVVETAADEMVDGAYIGEGANSPASFYDDPHDDGADGDETADDGWFTTVGQPGGKVNDYDEVTIRMGAKDASETIVIADVVLPILP
jgi:hypothetical protein